MFDHRFRLCQKALLKAVPEVGVRGSYRLAGVHRMKEGKKGKKKREVS